MLTPEVEALIAIAYAEGYKQFGDLGLDLHTFTQRILSILHKHLGPSPSKTAAMVFVKELRGPDLYLASACAQHSLGRSGPGDAAADEKANLAWKTFDSLYKNYIRNLSHLFYRGGFVADDLADNILADMFLMDRSGISRIASYDGRSSLSTWLRVVLCNRAINASRRSGHISQKRELQPDTPDEQSVAKVELTVLAQRYLPAIEDSLIEACRNLSPRERLILLWRYEESRPLGQIARLLGIHQSNVTRQLERLQRRLREEVMATLSTRHGLSRAAIEECLADIVDNPGYAVSFLDIVKNSRK